MKKLLLYFSFGIIFLFFTACTNNNNINYIPKKEAIKNNFIVIDGSLSENKETFYSFLNNSELGKDSNINVAIYDLIDNSYIINIDFKDKTYLASGYFINTESKISNKFTNLIYTDLIKTSSKNYFLRDSNGINEDLWIFQDS